MTTEVEQKILTWEKHGSAIFGALTVTLMVWIGSSVVDMREDVAVMKVQMANALDIQSDLVTVRKEHVEMFMHIQMLDERMKELKAKE